MHYAVFVSRNQSFDRLCYPGEIQLRRQVVLVWGFREWARY